MFLVIGQRLEKLFQTMYLKRGRYIRKLAKNTLKKRGKRYWTQIQMMRVVLNFHTTAKFCPECYKDFTSPLLLQKVTPLTDMSF